MWADLSRKGGGRGILGKDSSERVVRQDESMCVPVWEWSVENWWELSWSPPV